MVQPTIIPVTPRVLNTASLCIYLGRSPTWLAQNRGVLEAQGFPRPDPLLGGYDRLAVDLWLDGRSEIFRVESAPLAGSRSWDKPVR